MKANDLQSLRHILKKSAKTEKQGLKYFEVLPGTMR